jgi:hypothetical protein
MNWREWIAYILVTLLAVAVGAVYAMVIAILLARYGLLPSAALPALGNPSGG